MSEDCNCQRCADFPDILHAMLEQARWIEDRNSNIADRLFAWKIERHIANRGPQ